MKLKPKVTAVVGATASGKTACAIALAKEIDGEIISADSRLVYKGFNVGCAKPSIEEREGIPHYMLDIVEPEFDYTAGLYAKEASKCIYDIVSRGKMPIVAGGTGLYLRLLLENYDLPSVEPDYNLRKSLKNLPNEELCAILSELDDTAVLTVEQNDRRKLIRAIEIVKVSGKPLAKARGIKEESEFDVSWIGCNFPRDVLYDRINARVDSMLEKGLIDETKKLLEKHGRIPNLIYTIGYQEIVSYLDGIITLDEAVEKLKQNTRHYAKRQLTWFRKNSNIKWNFYPESLEK